jgi:type VII secretion protein EccB
MTEPRRTFTSRSPVNENPDRVVYRRGFVTRHQVSGWRFVMRRIASGVALHDTRMLVDPLRTQTRAVLVGALVLITGLAGCFVFSLIRPGGVAGNDAILADRATSALYVRLGDRLHPVLNLTSARLIAGRPDNPTTVKTSEIDRFPRGNLIGIPGAPERMVQNTNRDADWTVCDGTAGPAAGVTMIAGPLSDGGERATTLPPDEAVLVANADGPNAGTWLLWQGRRSRVDLDDRAVASALGLSANISHVRPVAAGLFNAIPEAPALRAPTIPGAGESTRYPLPVPAPVGAVVASFDTDNTLRHYAVLSDGLQPISPVVAAILRNTNSFGLEQSPRLGADDIARLPVANGIDNDAYPGAPITVVDPADAPLTCAQWTRPADATGGTLTLRSGVTLPVPDALRTVTLVGAGSGTTADRVVLTPGQGYLVQSVGQDGGGMSTSPTGTAHFWLSDTGVRYGLDDEGDEKTVAALGLNPPALPIPWSMLSQFAPGPTLARADALLAHDALAADPRPAVVRETP